MRKRCKECKVLADISFNQKFCDACLEVSANHCLKLAIQFENKIMRKMNAPRMVGGTQSSNGMVSKYVEGNRRYH